MSGGITMDRATYNLYTAFGTVHTTVTWHLQRAREAYARGSLRLEELERCVEHVLRGGYLGPDLEPRAPIMDRVRTRRKQLACPHRDLYDIRSFDGQQDYICADCGATTFTRPYGSLDQLERKS